MGHDRATLEDDYRSAWQQFTDTIGAFLSPQPGHQQTTAGA